MPLTKTQLPDLKAGIHTVTMLSRYFADISRDEKDYLSRDIKVYFSKNSDQITHPLYGYALNPNCHMAVPVTYEFSKFKSALDFTIKDMGIPDYERMSRVDFCFDCVEGEYGMVSKLNRALILTLALQYSVRNRYESFDPLTLERETIRIQSKHFQAEYYNKRLHAPEMGIISRLELRSVSIPKDYSFESIFGGWEHRLNKSLAKFDEVKTKSNRALIQLWSDEERNQLRTENEFIRKYRDFIYSEDQLIELYELMGKKAPVKATQNFTLRNDIEFLTSDILSDYGDLIIDTAKVYFSS